MGNTSNLELSQYPPIMARDIVIDSFSDLDANSFEIRADSANIAQLGRYFSSGKSFGIVFDIRRSYIMTNWPELGYDKEETYTDGSKYYTTYIKLIKPLHLGTHIAFKSNEVLLQVYYSKWHTLEGKFTPSFHADSIILKK